MRWLPQATPKSIKLARQVLVLFAMRGSMDAAKTQCTLSVMGNSRSDLRYGYGPGVLVLARHYELNSGGHSGQRWLEQSASAS